MCGICGLFGDFDLERIRPMAAALVHRGPDACGFHAEAGHGLALGHRRLSIIDLTSGDQPMCNEDRSIVVVFNGEIYNYLELRRELEANGHRFATRSDTETILHLYEDLGEDFPTRLNGDFSVAIYDRARGKLVLARDRLGIRPLYWWSGGAGLVFASEAKAIFASGFVDKTLNRTALASFLKLRYTPGPETLFAGIWKLPPGHVAVVTRDAPARLTMRPYWDVETIAPSNLSEQDEVDRCEELLLDAVRLRMRSDVPVAAFLSGGLDSSLIVKLMATHGVVHRAFSIGFHLDDIDENAAARRFAASLGIEHRDIHVRRDGYRDLPRIVGRMDDPVGDVIILPTHALAEEAAKEAKVVMTGEGADEVWGGYLHHFALNYLLGRGAALPGVTSLWPRLVRGAPLGLLSSLFPYPAALGERGREKLAALLTRARSPREAYLLFTSFMTDDDAGALLGLDAPAPPAFDFMERTDLSILRRIFAAERRAWLPDYTLMKQDTLSMANSLEGRVPFLDHRLVEFAMSLPDRAKVGRFRAKRLLRQVAARHIDPALAWRKKKAFYIPTERCFDEGLAGLYADYFDDALVAANGVFEPTKFKAMTKAAPGEILDQKRRNTLLIFQIWYNAQWGRPTGD